LDQEGLFLGAQGQQDRELFQTQSVIGDLIPHQDHFLGPFKSKVKSLEYFSFPK
jgi:hypothetical protein